MNFKILDNENHEISQKVIDKGEISRNNLELLVKEARWGDTLRIGLLNYYVRGRHLKIISDGLILTTLYVISADKLREGNEND